MFFDNPGRMCSQKPISTGLALESKIPELCKNVQNNNGHPARYYSQVSARPSSISEKDVKYNDINRKRGINNDNNIIKALA